MFRLFQKPLRFIACSALIISICSPYTADGKLDELVAIEAIFDAPIFTPATTECFTYTPFVTLIATTDVFSAPCETPKENGVSEEEVELLALLTMAEAEGECEEGQRLVIDTVLNRVDSEYFPDTITEVIYQRNQFSSMWNGRVDRCEVREDICQLVREELDARTNSDVIFFNSGRYSAYGQPLFQLGNHYFSSYH